MAARLWDVSRAMPAESLAHVDRTVEILLARMTPTERWRPSDSGVCVTPDLETPFH